MTEIKTTKKTAKKRTTKYGETQVGILVWVAEPDIERGDRYIQEFGLGNRNALMRKALKEFLTKHKVQ